MRTYSSDGVNVKWNGIIRPADAEDLIGKTISAVEASERTITLFFTDGRSLEVSSTDLNPPQTEVDVPEEDILELD